SSGVSSASSSSSYSSSFSSSYPMFVDETLPSFFRRPGWSPDGTFLLLPAGTYTDTENNVACSCSPSKILSTQCDCPVKPKRSDKDLYCTWLFYRDQM